MRYVYKRTRYVPMGKPDPEEVEEQTQHKLQKAYVEFGAAQGLNTVVYPDESGVAPKAQPLPPAYSWSAVRCVPRSWGRQGRVGVGA